MFSFKYILYCILILIIHGFHYSYGSLDPTKLPSLTPISMTIPAPVYLTKTQFMRMKGQLVYNMINIPESAVKGRTTTKVNMSRTHTLMKDNNTGKIYDKGWNNVSQIDVTLLTRNAICGTKTAVIVLEETDDRNDPETRRWVDTCSMELNVNHNCFIRLDWKNTCDDIVSYTNYYIGGSVAGILIILLIIILLKLKLCCNAKSTTAPHAGKDHVHTMETDAADLQTRPLPAAPRRPTEVYNAIFQTNEYCQVQYDQSPTNVPTTMLYVN